MRTFSIVASAWVAFAAVLGPGASVYAFDAGRTADAEAPVSPLEAFRSGALALRAGESEKAVTALQYAAEKGVPLAQWQLGRMYAEGNGVARDDVRAFDYFRQVVKTHIDEQPDQPQGPVVASAFVAVGQYYLTGIPNSTVKVDAGRARDMFSYAASYFGDPEAQFRLGRLYLDGQPRRDAKQAVRWLALSANKGHPRAQALLGRVLFAGQGVPRQRPLGLMWMTLACDGPGGKVEAITEQRETAFEQASEDERAMALTMLENWMNGRRDW